MKKANRIMMATVSMLLCLVLITTSVVSGVFARFVIKNTATSPVTFKKFNVVVTMTPNAKLTTAGATVTTRTNGKSAKVTISGLKLAPGDDWFNAVNFAFTNKTAFKTYVKIYVDLEYTNIHSVIDPETEEVSDSSFVVPADTDLPGITSKTYFMPIGFTFSSGATSAAGHYVVEPWLESDSADDTVSASAIKTDILNGINSKITDPTTNKVVQDGYAQTYFGSGATVQWTIDGTTARKDFDLGFAWPDAGSNTAYDYDLLSTYLIDNADEGVSFSITYTVELSQTS